MINHLIKLVGFIFLQFIISEFSTTDESIIRSEEGEHLPSTMKRKGISSSSAQQSAVTFRLLTRLLQKLQKDSGVFVLLAIIHNVWLLQLL